MEVLGSIGSVSCGSKIIHNVKIWKKKLCNESGNVMVFGIDYHCETKIQSCTNID